jgi:uncharacterized protein
MRPVFTLLLLVLLNVSALALKPTHVYTVIPDTLGLRYEKNTIVTADGVHIKTWTFIPADSINNKITLVVAHADAGNMSWNIMQAAFMVQNGYTVTLFDYRGFGESDSFAINNNQLYYNEFVNDLSAVVKDDRKRFPKNKTGIWAFSMGTIITSLLPADVAPDFIVGDSYVINLQQVLTAAKANGKDLVLPSGSDKYEKAVYSLKKPMIVFTGTKDNVAPITEVMKLKEKKPSINVITYDGGHLQGFFILSKTFTGSEYIGDVNTFVQSL